MKAPFLPIQLIITNSYEKRAARLEKHRANKTLKTARRYSQNTKGLFKRRHDDLIDLKKEIETINASISETV